MTEATKPIDVLVVEDDQVAADAHRTYVDRIPGFRVARVAHSGAQALRLVERAAGVHAQ